MKKNRIFNEEQEKYIYENYKGISSIQLADIINEEFKTNVSSAQVRNFKSRKKLTSGYNSQFKKGQKSHNAGKKMPSEIYEKCKKTMFQKGNIPPKHKPIGTESVSKGYVIVKVKEPNEWKLKQRYLYERAYGELKKDEIIIFADGNIRNFGLDNLVKITRKELVLVNKKGLYLKEKDLTKAGINLLRLEKIIKDKER